MSAWDVQAGIQKIFWAPGETAFWGGYGQVNDGLGAWQQWQSALGPPC